MTVAEIAVTCGGVLTMMMGAFHITFPKRFGWAADFAKASATNVRVLTTIHLALLILFLLVGALTIVFHADLASARGLGGGLTLVMGLFWGWRAVWQLIYFRPPSGPGGAARRRLHYAVACHFVLSCLTYLAPFAL